MAKTRGGRRSANFAAAHQMLVIIAFSRTITLRRIKHDQSTVGTSGDDHASGAIWDDVVLDPSVVLLAWLLWREMPDPN
jgi:hypothetical protein